MRLLSPSYLHALKSGFLSPLLERVKADPDLDLQIRENYINLYYKGHSLLKLDELAPNRYHPYIHPKFLDGLELVDFTGEATLSRFLDAISVLKENILLHGVKSIETEYEQMIIRANNDDPHNNSDYFIVDRQYSAGPQGRFDLTGFCWPWQGRRRGQEASVCLIELKYALNKEIQNVHGQILRYYQHLEKDPAGFAREAQGIFRQKLELGLLAQPADRLEALKTLTFSGDLGRFQFILALVDYNPNSEFVSRMQLSNLPFASQIRIWRTGFALWQENLAPGSQ